MSRRNIFLNFSVELIVGHVEEGEQAVPAGAMKLGGSVQVTKEEYDNFKGSKEWLLDKKLSDAMTHFPPDMLEQVRALADKASESDGPSRIITPGMDPAATQAARSILAKK